MKISAAARPIPLAPPLTSAIFSVFYDPIILSAVTLYGYFIKIKYPLNIKNIAIRYIKQRQIIFFFKYLET